MAVDQAASTKYRVTHYGQHAGDLTRVSGGWQFSPVAMGYLPSSFAWPTPEIAARECVGAAAIVEIAP
jgi:hypothetical protein